MKFQILAVLWGMIFMLGGMIGACGTKPPGSPTLATPTPSVTPTATSTSTAVPYFPVTITASDTAAGANVQLTWQNGLAINGSLSFTSPGSATTVVSWAAATSIMTRLEVSPGSSDIKLIVSTPYAGPVTSSAALAIAGIPSENVGAIGGYATSSSPLTIIY